MELKIISYKLSFIHC